MEYDQVPVDDDLVAEERKIRIQKRLLHTCLAVFIVTKVCVILWIFTMSFPLDAIGRLFRGEWWGDERD